MLDLVVLGLARNCRSAIPRFAASVQRWRDAGLSVKTLIGEDGSVDGTRAAILDAGLGLVDTTPVCLAGNRFLRMAEAREAVRRAYVSGEDARAVLLVDVEDDFISSIAASWLVDTIDRLHGEPEVFAFSAISDPYYDLIAFESETISYGNVWDRIDAESTIFTRYVWLKKFISAPQRALASGRDMRCISAFNGACLYKGRDYATTSYLPQLESPICEHVVFNRRLAERGRFMIVDHTLVVSAPAEHIDPGAVKYYWNRLLTLRKRIFIWVSLRLKRKGHRRV